MRRAFCIVAVVAFLVSSSFAKHRKSKPFVVTSEQRITGRLLDPQGAIVEGLTLELLSGRKVVKKATTNDKGGYDFGLVGPGEYRIRVVHNQFCAPKITCDDACQIEEKIDICEGVPLY